jgi:hypothetical protein
VKDPDSRLLKELQLGQKAYMKKKRAEERRGPTPERSPSPPVARRRY